jgi:hypothetical protein
LITRSAARGRGCTESLEKLQRGSDFQSVVCRGKPRGVLRAEVRPWWGAKAPLETGLLAASPPARGSRRARSTSSPRQPHPAACGRKNHGRRKGWWWLRSGQATAAHGPGRAAAVLTNSLCVHCTHAIQHSLPG